jgi:2-dehydro-3-deoxy-D-arabinonate dehydratase
MKIYKLKKGLMIERDRSWFRLTEVDWDHFINDDRLLDKAMEVISSLSPAPEPAQILREELVAPIGGQELWASGVTYFRSKQGRQEESREAGGADFYSRVYEAARPELFFKATRERVVGHGEKVRIRKDSSWDVPEPELVLMLSSNGKLVGYTLGNDMSSRSIEGENPLYLPQAKTYDGCAALGPCVLVAEEPLAPETTIRLTIRRRGTDVFGGEVAISQIKRSFEELAGYLFRELSFSKGVLLMTGTGIVPGRDFTLRSGDLVTISVDEIGTLANEVA